MCENQLHFYITETKKAEPKRKAVINWTYIKIWTFFSSKTNTLKVRREATEMIFAIHITNKGLMSRKYKGLLHITKKDRQLNRKVGKRPRQANRYPNDQSH